MRQIEGRLTDVLHVTQHAMVYDFALGLGGDEKVLDVGTGDGSPLMKALSWTERKPGLVVASDANWEIMVDLQRNDEVSSAAAKERLPFADGVFDVTISSQVIEHIPRENHVDFVRELVRVTRPGGYVIISTVDHNFPYSVKGHKDHIAEIDRKQAECLTEESCVLGEARLMVLVGSERFLRGQKQRAKFWWLRPIKDAIPKPIFTFALGLLTKGEIRPDTDLREDFWIKPIEEIRSDEVITDFVFVVKKGQVLVENYLRNYF